MSTLSTHVLDTSLGRPAEGIKVHLSAGARSTAGADGGGRFIASASTDVDGRAKDLQGAAPLDRGIYVLTFEVGPYFAKSDREAFYETIVVEFKVESDRHYHVPLLLSPFGYSTYRGS